MFFRWRFRDVKTLKKHCLSVFENWSQGGFRGVKNSVFSRGNFHPPGFGNPLSGGRIPASDSGLARGHGQFSVGGLRPVGPMGRARPSGVRNSQVGRLPLAIGLGIWFGNGSVGIRLVYMPCGSCALFSGLIIMAHLVQFPVFGYRKVVFGCLIGIRQ